MPPCSSRALAQAEFLAQGGHGATGQEVASGWNGLSCSDAGGTTSVSGVYGDVTVTVSSEVEGTGYMNVRIRNAVTSSDPPGDVVRDFIFSEDHDLTFTLDGLAAGTYSMTTYQHDPAYGGIGRLVPTVTVTDADGTNVAATDVYDTTGFNAPFSYGFVPNGEDYYQKKRPPRCRT